MNKSLKSACYVPALQTEVVSNCSRSQICCVVLQYLKNGKAITGTTQKWKDRKDFVATLDKLQAEEGSLPPVPAVVHTRAL